MEKAEINHEVEIELRDEEDNVPQAAPLIDTWMKITSHNAARKYEAVEAIWDEVPNQYHWLFLQPSSNTLVFSKALREDLWEVFNIHLCERI